MGHAITNLVDGFEVDRFVAELFAEPADMRVQCSRSCLAVISPDSVHQPLAREHVSTRAHEFLEKLEFFRRQRDRSITGKYLAALRKELDLADAEHVCPILANAAENRFHTQNEFARAERLHHVIVGAKLEPDDAVTLFGAGGEHDDRNAAGVRAHPKRTAHFQAIEIRQHDVENDQIGWLFPDAFERGRTRYRVCYSKSGLAEVVTDETLDVGIIVHDQDAFHDEYPGPSPEIRPSRRCWPNDRPPARDVLQ